MEKRIWRLEDPEVQRAKEAYEAKRRSGNCGCTAAFGDLWDAFQSDLSLAQVGCKYGISKQAIHQIYKRYFEPFLGLKSERTENRKRAAKALIREAELQQKLEQAQADPTYHFIKEEAGKRGKSVVPVVDLKERGLALGQNPAYQVDGSKLMRLHRRTAEFHPCGEEADQRYVSFQVSESMLKGINVYALLIDVPSLQKELMLIRATLLRKIIRKNEARSWTFYVPVGAYRRRHRIKVFDLRKFVDAWWIFDL